MPGSRVWILVHHFIYKVEQQKVPEKGSGITKQYFKKDQPQRYVENEVEREMRNDFAIILAKKKESGLRWWREEKGYKKETLHKKNW